MATLIKIINNHILIEFDKGRFDNWCVYLTKKGNKRYAPLDAEYFGRLQAMGKAYSCKRIYNDFLKFYRLTDKTINHDILKMIAVLAESYAEDEEEINVWFTVIYAGMVAEENKAKGILKKRVKGLGMYQALMENLAPEDAANFSKGKTWNELDLIMKDLGI